LLHDNLGPLSEKNKLAANLETGKQLNPQFLAEISSEATSFGFGSSLPYSLANKLHG
jgi:hypothetical protein